MPNTVRFFRDTLTLNQSLIDSLGATPGDTLVVAAEIQATPDEDFCWFR